jgi:hypothetical protein
VRNRFDVKPDERGTVPFSVLIIKGNEVVMDLTGSCVFSDVFDDVFSIEIHG